MKVAMVEDGEITMTKMGIVGTQEGGQLRYLEVY